MILMCPLWQMVILCGDPGVRVGFEGAETGELLVPLLALITIRV